MNRYSVPAVKSVLWGGGLLAALWLVDLFVLRTPVLTPFARRPALTPLYAFWLPLLRPQALLFAAAAATLACVSCRLADPARTPRTWFVASLLVASVALPLTLFVARQDPAELGSQFLIYPKEEFFADARQIGDLREFVGSYVDRMPDLSLHGRHFPPGHAALLYGVGKVFGAGTLPAGVTVLVCFAAAMTTAYLGLARHAGEAAGRQGVLLLLASPSLLDFACTSMDAVFLLYATVAWRLALGAFSTGRARAAVWTGLALFAASMASFSALVVGLAVSVYGIACWGRLRAKALRQLAVVAASFVAGGALVYAATGFSLRECFAVARFQNVALMTRVIGRDPAALYGRIAFGNLAAFAIGAGLGLVSALALRLRASGSKLDPWTAATAATLAVMTFGGFYTMETERIWLYALPWIALVAVSARPLQCAALRVLLAAGWAQSLAMEVLLFTLW